MAEIERIKRNISKMIDMGAPEADIDAYLSSEGVTVDQLRGAPSFDMSMDKNSGAPVYVRGMVGGSDRKTEDRLSTLRKYYPDAKPYGNDNFIFTDPKTKRPTLFNPSGLDVGDIAESGRMLAEMGGGVIGGAIGAMTSAPTGLLSAPVTVPVGVGLGAEAAGQIYDLGLQWMGNRDDTRSLGHRMSDASVGVTLNAAGQKIATEIPHMLKNSATLVKNKLAKSSGAGLLNDYTSAQIPIDGSVGALTGQKWVQGTNNALAQLPSSSNTMDIAADKTLKGISDYADEVARMYGAPLTKQGAGEVVRGAAKNAGERFVNRRTLLDDSVVELVGPNTTADITPVISLLDKMKAQLAKNPKTSGYLKKAIAEAQKIVDDGTPVVKEGSKPGALAAYRGVKAEPDVVLKEGISFDGLRTFRTDIGKKLDAPDAATGYVGKEAGAVRQLYGAIKESLKRTASGVSDDAAKALDVHDRYVRYNNNINLPDLNDLAKKDAEMAFDFVMNRSKDGGVKLSRLRKNFTQEEWDVVAATTIRRMGTAKPGAQNIDGDLFSADTFMSNWNTIAPEAKASLFNGKRYAPLRKELDRLARISASAKDVNKMKNYSGTAQQHVYMQLLMGGGGAGLGYIQGGSEGAIAGAAMPFVLPRAAAKLMTNPKFVRWLADGSKISPVNYNGLSGHLGRLVTIGKAEPVIKQEIEQFIDAFRSISPNAIESYPQREPRQGRDIEGLRLAGQQR